jgi:hypothetical protein
LSSAGKYAFSRNCTIVTKPAIIVTKAGILTLSGITFLVAAITAFDPTSTAVVANPIPTPLIAAVVTASVGQVPSTSLKVGFSFTKPFVKVFNTLI